MLAELTQEEERHLTERNPALRHMLGRGTAAVQDWLTTASPGSPTADDFEDDFEDDDEFG